MFFTDNVGEGKALGAEAEVRWWLNDRWQLYGNVGLLDAELESGREQAHAPRYTVAAGFEYQRPDGLFFRLDATAKDAFYFDVSHDQRSQSFALMHLKLGYETDNWRTSIWARNLFDRDYAVRGFYFGNEPPDFPNRLYTRAGDPRQIGITLDRSF